MQKPKISLKLIIAGLVVVLLALIMLLSALLKKDGQIYSGIYVDGVELSNLSKEKALNLLKDKYEQNNIKLTYEDKEYNINLQEVGFKIEAQEAVDKAYNIGRDGQYFSNLSTAISHTFFGQKEELPLKKNIDEEALAQQFDTISSEIDKKSKNAGINIGQNISVIEGENGIAVDKDKLKQDILKAIHENKNPIEVTITTKEITPDITSDMLKGINGLMASYVTTFSNPQNARGQNVSLAASRVNQKLIMPGEEFSFLKTVGEISIDSGYKKSIVIIDGEYEDGIGGGVCQVSSTMYNAMLISGLKVVSRYAHSYSQAYVPPGRDATIAIPGPDMVFKNNYEYPVFLINYTSGNKMISEVYGNIDNFSPTTISTQTIETYEPKIKYIDDPNLPKGKEIVEKSGKTGQKVITYITKNGQKEYLNTSVYPAKSKEVRRGTGKEEAEKENPKPQENPIQETPESAPSSIF